MVFNIFLIIPKFKPRHSSNMHLYDIDCPECGIRCWVNNGDITDQTVSDVEAVRCWNCHHEFMVDPYNSDPEMSLEDFRIHDTYQSASQAAGNK